MLNKQQTNSTTNNSSSNVTDGSRNELNLFSFSDQKVRTLLIDDKPWFVAKDVCDILGLGKYRDAISTLKDYERESELVDTLGGKQKVSIINESGLYRLMFRSRKPFAEKFTQWVTEEVLPNIRKHGFYMSTQAETTGKFEGLTYVMYNGQKGYCYIDVLRKVGFSTKSGSVARRKKRYINNYFQLFGRNFCTAEFAQHLIEEKALIDSRVAMQQVLPFDSIINSNLFSHGQ